MQVLDGSHAIRSIISGTATLEKVAAFPNTNVTVALSPTQQIVGYIECSYPDVVEGWRDNADGLRYELGAIEVSRNWRRLGIAHGNGRDDSRRRVY